MNRATFFKSLFFGAVSAPAIAKVLAEEKKPDERAFWDTTGCDTTDIIHGDFGWYHYESHITLGLDDKPMRFDV